MGIVYKSEHNPNTHYYDQFQGILVLDEVARRKQHEVDVETYFWPENDYITINGVACLRIPKARILELADAIREIDALPKKETSKPIYSCTECVHPESDHAKIECLGCSAEMTECRSYATTIS